MSNAEHIHARMNRPLLVIFMTLALVAVASAQALQSLYTDLGEKKCKTLEVNNEGAGYSIQQCPGVAGYKIIIEEGDLRQTIKVVRPNGSKHDLGLAMTIGGGGFSHVGPRAEWRVKTQSGKTVPVALIVRFNVSENAEDATKETSYLAVAKITPQQICLTDSVKPGPGQNEEARRLADSSATKPCLRVPE